MVELLEGYTMLCLTAKSISLHSRDGVKMMTSATRARRASEIRPELSSTFPSTCKLPQPDGVTYIQVCSRTLFISKMSSDDQYFLDVVSYPSRSTNQLK